MDYYFVGGSQRASCFLTAALLLVAVAISSCSSPFSKADLRGQESDVAGGENNARVLKRSVSRNKPRVDGSVPDEKSTIQPIHTPFLQSRGDWMQPGKGISMCSNGEPKSGTTWTERIITELAVQLCGSPSNTWCQMGGLVVHGHNPAPNYKWEMVYVDTGELFLHFNGWSKHKMIGLDVEGCNPRGRQHRNGFDTDFPCLAETKNRTRESIYECLPDTSERCAKLRPSQDPADLRISAVFRDPRDVVISELRMRNRGKESDTSKLNSFIYERFEAIVSWQYYRWMWYTTYYKYASHVMFYEDIKSKPEALADLASFMGLNSSLEQIRNIQEMHRNESPNGKYDSYGLPLETLKYMNATMLKLSPEELLARYGLSPYPR